MLDGLHLLNEECELSAEMSLFDEAILLSCSLEPSLDSTFCKYSS